MRHLCLIAAVAILGCGVRGPPRPPLKEVTGPAAPQANPAPACAPAADAGAPAPTCG